MKKILLTVLALIATGGSMMAGDKPVITVADVEALPGETVSFTVNMVDGKADTYTAMTLYAYFPTDGFVTTGTYSVASAWVGASGSVGYIDTTTGLATIPFASENAIPGSEVDNLVTVNFTVDNSIAVGEYSVTLKGTMFEYNLSDKDYADDVTFKIKVVSAHSVILDELSTTAPAAASGVNVKVKRTLNANKWNTICLPFAIPAEKMTAAFGDGVILKNFKSYTYDNTEDALTISFESASAIEANHPYLIKVNSNITEFTVDGVDIAPEDNPCVEYDNGKTGKQRKVLGTFAGTYVADFDFYNASENYPIFVNDSKFYYATDNTKHMKAFRAYFDFVDYISTVENASSHIFMIDDALTAIDRIETTKLDVEGYYDLQGRKVSEPTKKGLYISNGRKVVVK